MLALVKYRLDRFIYGIVLLMGCMFWQSTAQAQDHLYVDLTESLKAIGYKPFRYEGVPLKTKDDIIGALNGKSSGKARAMGTHYYPFNNFAVNSTLQQFAASLDQRAFQLPDGFKKSKQKFDVSNKIVTFDLVPGDVGVQAISHRLLELSSRTGSVKGLAYYSENILRAEVVEKSTPENISVLGYKAHYEFIDTVSEQRFRLSDELPFPQTIHENHLGLEHYVVAYRPGGKAEPSEVRYAIIKFDPFTRSHKILLDNVPRLIGRKILTGLVDEPGRSIWPQGDGDVGIYFDLETEFGPKPMVMIIDQDVVNFIELPSGRKPGPWIINTVNLVEDERSRYAFKGHYSTKWFFPAGVIEDVQHQADLPKRGHYLHRVGQRSIQLVENRLIHAGYMNGGIMGVSYNNQTGEVGLQRSIYDAEALDSNPMAPVLSPSCGRVIK